MWRPTVIYPSSAPVPRLSDNPTRSSSQWVPGGVAFSIFCWLKNLQFFMRESYQIPIDILFFGGVLLSLFTYEQWYIPSGYLTVRHGKIHHFYPYLSSVNHLFLWAIYTMAMSAITRWYHQYILDFPNKTSIYKGFSMAMSAITRCYHQYILDFSNKISIYKGFSMAMSAIIRWYIYSITFFSARPSVVFIWASSSSSSSHFSIFLRLRLNLLMNSRHYPLVDIQKLWKLSPCLMGKSQKTMEFITIL